VVAQHAVESNDFDSAKKMSMSGSSTPARSIPEVQENGVSVRDQDGAEFCHISAGFTAKEDDSSRSRSLDDQMRQIRTAREIVTSSIVRWQSARDLADLPALGSGGTTSNFSLRRPERPSLVAEEMEGHANISNLDLAKIPSRLTSASLSHTQSLSESVSVPSPSDIVVPEILCHFRCGLFPVWVAPARRKGVSRMKEKVQEYIDEGMDWPRAACILDPVRASIVCDGSAQIIEVAEWFLAGQGGRAPHLNAFPVCRVKNKFALPSRELVSFCAVMSGTLLAGGCGRFAIDVTGEN
jgi:hypothetical protein